jgi:hypothetical protein
MSSSMVRVSVWPVAVVTVLAMVARAPGVPPLTTTRCVRPSISSASIVTPAATHCALVMVWPGKARDQSCA